MCNPIRLYIGVSETKWNNHPTAPGDFACVSPVYGRKKGTKKKNSIRLPSYTSVLSDSGAFSDDPISRCTFKAALSRQLDHGRQYNYIDRLAGFASYDLLIDEKWFNGQRTKRRWSRSEAEYAVDETVKAASFLSKSRDDIPSPLVLSAQGVTPQQYEECVKRIASFFFSGDILGLGGWCILGMRTSLLRSFYATMLRVIPLAAQFTKSVHIWGVLYAPAIGALLWLCDQYGLSLSTDSTGPSIRPARGVWGYMGWVDRSYKRHPVRTRGLERARHVEATRRWLENFRESKYYKQVTLGPEQLAMSGFGHGSSQFYD